MEGRDAVEEGNFTYVVGFVFKKLLLWHGCSEYQEQFNLGQITPVTIATYLDQRFKKIYFSPDNLLQVES